MSQNTVSAAGQLKQNRVFVHEKEHADKKILFVGNSTTLHGVKEDIGWYHAWGMAASSEERDYVHVTVQMLEDAGVRTSFCVCQVSAWEVNYKNGSGMLDTYKAARDFNADIIVMNFVGNCPRADFDADVFEREYKALLDYLNRDHHAKIILCTNFHGHPGDERIIKTAGERSYSLITLKDLGADDAMTAKGLFEHQGVANHPGDLGMKMTAERIFHAAEKFI